MTKSILITGCSSGIGADCAQVLKRRGWRVFAACRKRKDCERLEALGFESPLIDYSDASTIHKGFSEVMEATNGSLDALFNNGACGLFGAVEDISTAGLREIFETNFFGWHELTRLVLPVMRSQGAGRLVQCSSTLGFCYLPWRGAYTATKHALEALSNTLRIELRETNIRVIVIEPGPITTLFRQNSALMSARWIDWDNSPYTTKYNSGLRQRLSDGRGKKDPFELPPSAVSKKVIKALESRNPRPRYMVTGVTYIAAALCRGLPMRTLDKIAAQIS
ncbi:MAG: SDR family NAD(P)-dependent oxidoreductase [Aestuariivita sp.]|nr:SDR family NAD(P)-dependent oxidoreductase [Aestuariivita sp.]MCY4202430.1 SDR family NAD(P)-dependent oxidoreductase [Aestuariivita sp.]